MPILEICLRKVFKNILNSYSFNFAYRIIQKMEIEESPESQNQVYPYFMFLFNT